LSRYCHVARLRSFANVFLISLRYHSTCWYRIRSRIIIVVMPRPYNMALVLRALHLTELGKILSWITKEYDLPSEFCRLRHSRPYRSSHSHSLHSLSGCSLLLELDLLLLPPLLERVYSLCDVEVPFRLLFEVFIALKRGRLSWRCILGTNHFAALRQSIIEIRVRLSCGIRRQGGWVHARINECPMLTRCGAPPI
jgi:hypothetical protein